MLIFVISLSAHMLLFYFYPWPFVLSVSLFCSNFVIIFSIAVPVFLNLFWKTCPLFRQILITCLNCFRAFFLLSSFSDKMHLGQGCDILNMSIFILNSNITFMKYFAPVRSKLVPKLKMLRVNWNLVHLLFRLYRF